MAIGEKVVAFLLRIKLSLIWWNLTELTPLSNRTCNGGKESTSLFIKTIEFTVFLCDFVLSWYLLSDLAGLGGIEIHGHLTSYSTVLCIHVSGYKGTGVSGYRVSVTAGYQGLVTWLLCSLVS